MIFRAAHRPKKNHHLRLELLEDRLQPGSIFPGLAAAPFDPALGDLSTLLDSPHESRLLEVSRNILRRDQPESSFSSQAIVPPGSGIRENPVSPLGTMARQDASSSTDGRLIEEMHALNARVSQILRFGGEITQTSAVSGPTAHGTMLAGHPAPGIVKQIISGVNQEPGVAQAAVQSRDVSIQPMEFAVVKHYNAGGKGGPAPDSELQWSTYVTGSPTSATGRGVAVDQGGNSYVTGFTGDGPDRAGFVAKYTNTGRQIYYSAFQAVDPDPAFTYSETEGHGIAVDSLGNIYVTGTATRIETGNRQAFALKFDTLGNIVPGYGGGIAYTPSSDSSGEGIAVTANGLATLTGTFQVQGNENEIFAVKFNAPGNRALYAVGYQFPGFDGSAGMAITLDSTGDNAYLAGSILPTGGDNDILVMEVDNTGPMAGRHASYALSAQNAGDDTLTGIAVNSAGNAFVSGTVTDGGQLKAYVAEITTQGDDLEFAQIYDGTLSATSLAIDTAGNSYFTGAVALDDGSIHALVAKVDLQGNPLDTTALTGDTSETGAGLAFRSGNVYLTGTTSSTNLATDDTFLMGTSDAFLAEIANFN